MPFDRSLYPDNWPELSRFIRFERAKGRCECKGECGRPHPRPFEDPDPDAPARCMGSHGWPHPQTGSRVVLTAAHLDHNPANPDPENLRAFCQLCHNRYDAAHRAAHRAARLLETNAAHSGQTLLWNDPEPIPPNTPAESAVTDNPKEPDTR